MLPRTYEVVRVGDVLRVLSILEVEDFGPPRLDLKFPDVVVRFEA